MASVTDFVVVDICIFILVTNSKLMYSVWLDYGLLFMNELFTTKQGYTT